MRQPTLAHRVNPERRRQLPATVVATLIALMMLGLLAVVLRASFPRSELGDHLVRAECPKHWKKAHATCWAEP